MLRHLRLALALTITTLGLAVHISTGYALGWLDQQHDDANRLLTSAHDESIQSVTVDDNTLDLAYRHGAVMAIDSTTYTAVRNRITDDVYDHTIDTCATTIDPAYLRFRHIDIPTTCDNLAAARADYTAAQAIATTIRDAITTCTGGTTSEADSPGLRALYNEALTYCQTNPQP